MQENYPSASEMVRNLADVRVRHEVIEERGKFRVVQFVSPFWEGYEFWVVNERGFLWEPADSRQQALAYLDSDEAREYQES